ncbi:MAG: hypothetical protein IJ009_05915 [Clostridia bacterium]|nr:hypothetical protein [Clostridia bacterium]
MKYKLERNPLIVMTAVTGKPSKEKIFAYLDELRENGIGQSLLYPRSGCELEYRSEEWFERIGFFLEGARERGMAVWLYDDFNWPSGDAAGKVSAIPSYRLKAIKTRGKAMGEIVDRSNHNAQLFGEKHFPDLMSEKAVDYFISLTHEEYYKRFSEYFGDVIVGIFTDEPGIGYCCRAKNGETEEHASPFDIEDGLMPYYDGIKEDYRCLCHRDFDEDMKNGHEDFYSNSVSLFSSRFKTCYIDRLSDWCRAHGIVMTGHLWCDDTPFYSTKANGDFLTNLSGFMMPGLDDIYTDLHSEGQLSLLAAAQYARGDHGAMIELFALGPCDMTYSKRLCAIFLSSCFGINRYFLAISPLDMRGNFHITDFFSCFTAAQPDFAGMRLLAEQAALAAQYADMNFTPDVYIRHPYPICAKHYADDHGKDTGFTTLLNALSRHQIQWKYATADTDCGEIPVISWTESMEYSCEGSISRDPEALCRRFQKPLHVTDRNGNTPEGIFVRRFDNGEMVVLNLFGEANLYVIDGNAVFLAAHAVWHSRAPFDERVHRCPLQENFALHYRNDNLTRLMFLNDTTLSELECRGSRFVTISVRTDTQALVDGDRLTLAKPALILPCGMKEFYQSTAPIELDGGIHSVTSGGEYKYLPSVLVSGSFSVDIIPNRIYRLVLQDRKETYTVGEYFSDYGQVEFCASISIPEWAEAIELNGSTLYTCLYLNGQRIGECIAAPYRYAVPVQFRGKTAELCILQSSGLGPVFGDTVHYDTASKHVSWRDTPATTVTRFGFSEICYVF